MTILPYTISVRIALRTAIFLTYKHERRIQMNKQLLSADTETDKTIISEDEITKTISKSLLDLGFRPSLKGFTYIKEAILLYSKILLVNSIFSDVYSKIAQKYGSSTTSIDCAIKKSIEDTWYKSKLNHEHQLFRWPIIKTEYHPTNLEFIATMAELIKIKIV